MRTALMLAGGCLAPAACDVTSDRPDQVPGGQGKGQPGPSSAPAIPATAKGTARAEPEAGGCGARHHR